MTANQKPMKLHELGTVARGRSRHRPRNEKSLFGGPYPFIQTGDIKDADLYLSHYTQTYNEKGLQQSKLWHPNTLCITIAANIAETAILKIDACFPDSVVGFVPYRDVADVRFVKYYLDTIKLQMQMASKGTTQDNLSLDKLLTFDISTPQLRTQRKIAAILSAYDELIENNTRRIAILEEMAQAIYQEWFVHFRYPGHEKNKMVESELGMILEGCKIEQLGKLATEVRKGVNPDTIDPETPYFGLEHLPKRSIALYDWGAAKEVHSTKFIFNRGDILFGKIRPYLHKVGVAPLDGICSSDTIVIVPKSDKYYGVILCCVSSENFVNYATLTSQGTQMPRVNWEVLKKYLLVLPPDPILAAFNEIVHSITSDIRNLIFRNQNLNRTRDLLLPKLISGEIDVEALDIDIPEVIEPETQQTVPTVVQPELIDANQLALPLS